MIEPEAPTSANRTGYKTLFILACVGILLGLILASYPRYLLWKKHRLNLLTTKAQGHIENEHWEQAYAILNQAYAQAPNDPLVLREIARLTQRTSPDPSRALFFWKQLLAYTSATTEDLAEMGMAYLADRQPDEAIKILSSFTPEQRSTKYSMGLESQLLYFQGKPLEAAKLHRKYLLQNPNDPENQLTLAILDLTSPFTEVQKNALEKLWGIARSKSPHAAAAIQSISTSPLLTGGMSTELLQLALNNQAISEKRYFEILSRHIILNPLKKKEIYASETNKYRNKTIQENAVFYHWLLQQEEYDLLLELVSKDKATQNVILFPVYLEALAGKSRWDELSDIFRRTPSLPLSSTDQSVLQARIAHGQGDKGSIVSGHLKEASRRAIIAKNFEALQRIITIADKLGFEDVAIEALINGSAIPQYQLSMLERLLNIYSRRGDAESMLTTLQKILEAKPMIKSHMENALYLKLLLGIEFESISKGAPLWAAQNIISNDSLPFINAFAAYRFRDFEKMKGVLTQIEVSKLSVGQRAVYSGMLASCGEQAKAFIIAEKISPARLLEGELIFLRKAL